ncbi:hypothetical protein AB0E83_24720 [Streptomyces sp. NPDC035033]|uniref:hypothetical protein n=1 Tax=Streptomyces sp. NPDC035033 TaxID=3155368 RepID=UPI0033C952B5
MIQTVQEFPIDLPGILLPDPEPHPGCTICADLSTRYRRYRGTDESAATDCAVEIRNHPHRPLKLRFSSLPTVKR